MTMQSVEVHLKRRPNGMPVAEDFAFVTQDLGDPGEGEVLVQNLFISVDPYMRGRMNEGKGYAEGYKLDEVMYGGRWVASLHRVTRTLPKGPSCRATTAGAKDS